MARLRRSDCTKPGISRRRRGRGFSYAHPDGRRISDEETLSRIRALAIPPAWSDVWICPWPNGHIQATGTDSAGRRQYRYHDQWRIDRDHDKFDRVAEFAEALPGLRAKVKRDLGKAALGRERVLAAIVRLLDVGLFRIGGEAYAEANATFGVSSLRKKHVAIRSGVMAFDYPAKGSAERRVEIDDADAGEVVGALLRRQTGGPHLFAYRRGRQWVKVRSKDVNDYVKDAAGKGFSAKDFRTWSATVLAAAELAEQVPAPSSKRERRASINQAVTEVARRLGDTPAVSRRSYIDPRVVDQYEDGHTIDKNLARRARRGDGPHPAVEEAVVDLIGGEEATS
ncbi:MAG: DNA topoisomerase IB [Acidimicrobiales bacterium]|nr:DNA topoisomerase IB [Acidimicrobiales bacterium]